jgi:hypothetical protein
VPEIIYCDDRLSDFSEMTVYQTSFSDTFSDDEAPAIVRRPAIFSKPSDEKELEDENSLDDTKVDIDPPFLAFYIYYIPLICIAFLLLSQWNYN